MPEAVTIGQLRHPFDGSLLLRHARRLKREGRERSNLTPVRVAILGGWTTQETATLLEIFLLSLGFRAEIWQSEYNRFFEDAVLDSAQLEAFQPQIVYVHTSSVNLRSFPRVSASKVEFEDAVAAELFRFSQVWEALIKKTSCTIIQNNFDLPLDPLGNLGASSYGGRRHFAMRLNLEFAERARTWKRLVVHDVAGLAAQLGNAAWLDSNRWFAYKIQVTPDANAVLAHSLACMIGSILGKARKCLVLDLDNTLWGGVIGDDGVDKIRLGRETPEAEAYSSFQEFCLCLQQRGVLLAVCSKNEEMIAKQGLAHPDSVLTLDKFAAFRANWEPKSDNLVGIAKELNIGLDSLVFVDDNPAEREIVRAQLPAVAVPEVGTDVSQYAGIICAGGYFETVGLSAEDLVRSELYGAESARTEAQSRYANYDEFLADLEMRAEIAPFSATYLDRITQLINKTNQFNLTTRRYTQAEVESAMRDADTVTLYGRLVDKFGDNGLISVIIGRRQLSVLHVELWLMSCRVLKRDMELAMLDALVVGAKQLGCRQLKGTYLRTEKNAMVASHYEKLGFKCLERTPDGSRTEWIFDIEDDYQMKNKHIAVSGVSLP